MEEPPAEGDAVCLVVEFFRINLIKVMQFIFLQDIRVKGSHAVDAEAVDVYKRQVYTFGLFNCEKILSFATRWMPVSKACPKDGLPFRAAPKNVEKNVPSVS